MTRQFNTRLPEFSHDQIDRITAEFGLTKIQVLILALDRLHRDLYPLGSTTDARIEAPLTGDFRVKGNDA